MKQHQKVLYHETKENLASFRTDQTVIFGDCSSMHEILNESVHAIVTSPPYYNAPHDYDGVFTSYPKYLELIRSFARESYRILQQGRIAAVNIDDMLVAGKKYPIVADTIHIFMGAGFDYRDHYI